MTGRVLTVFVAGHAKPKGSLRHVGNGRMIESADVAPWREAIAYAVHQEATRTSNPGWRRDTPVRVHGIFQLRRPASVKRDLPTVRPDVDKLARALLDALTDSGIIDDDAQVTQLFTTKGYATTADRPGVIVQVWEVEP